MESQSASASKTAPTNNPANQYNVPPRNRPDRAVNNGGVNVRKDSLQTFKALVSNQKNN